MCGVVLRQKCRYATRATRTKLEEGVEGGAYACNKVVEKPKYNANLSESHPAEAVLEYQSPEQGESHASSYDNTGIIGGKNESKAPRLATVHKV